MGIAKCGHCGGMSTKMELISPSGATYKHGAICCSTCSAILGVTGYRDSSILIDKQAKQIEALDKKLSDLIWQIQNRARLGM